VILKSQDFSLLERVEPPTIALLIAQALCWLHFSASPCQIFSISMIISHSDTVTGCSKASCAAIIPSF
jgi:hypothetical protein